MKKSPVGKTKDAGWQIGVSRTVHADLDEVWNYLMSTEGIAAWLGDGVPAPLDVGQNYQTDDHVQGEIRSLRPHDRVRLTWHPVGRHDHTTVQIAITPTATGCKIQFHTERLADNDERERMRTHWKAIADHIETILTERT